MLNLSMLLSVTVVTLAALKLAREHPELCSHPAFTFKPSTLRTICWTIVAMKTLIGGFFAIRMGWVSVGFAGLLAVTGSYAKLRPEKMDANRARSAEEWSGRWE